MKKLKLFSLLTIAMVMLSGCTKEYYDVYEQYYDTTIIEMHDQYYYDTTIVTGSQVLTYEYVISPAQWSRNQGSNLPGCDNYLYATFNNFDITQDVVDNGSVTADVWAIYNIANNLGAWNPLPYVYPIEITVDNNDGSTSITIVPENLRFEWEFGKVTFIIQDLDGFDPEDMINSIRIRVNVIRNGITN